MRPVRSPRPVAAFKPGLSKAEGEAARMVLAGGWAGSGIYVRLFERRLADAAGVPYAHAVTSATAALHLALKVLEVEGGEVITTPLTSPATNHAILHNRAVPVFCDVEEKTGNLDPLRVEQALGPRTRAIIAVHFNGLPAEMNALRALARRRGVPLVEDAGAALPLGGLYRGRPLGSLGDIAAFSFSRKIFSTLDGGAVLHRRRAWSGRLSRLRNLGQKEAGGAEERSRGLTEAGFPYRLNDVAAAMGLSQFERWEKTSARLAKLDRMFRAGLAGPAVLEFPAAPAHSVRSLSCFPVRVRSGKRALREFLRSREIMTDDWIYPNHLFPLYKPWRRRLPAAEKLARELVYLPFYPGLTDAEAGRVLDAVREFARGGRTRKPSA